LVGARRIGRSWRCRRNRRRRGRRICNLAKVTRKQRFPHSVVAAELAPLGAG
jgi:hypothetical protein